MEVFSHILQQLDIQEGAVVGVNGLDGAGKTEFARRFRDWLRNNALSCDLLHVDDFNNPIVQAEIYAVYETGGFNDETFERYYQDSIHYKDLRSAILAAQRSGHIVLVEGVFLFRTGLRDLFDAGVFIEVPFAEARVRFMRRRIEVKDTRSPSVFDDIWLPAFQRYCLEYRPVDFCSVRIDNTNYSHPKIIK